ncbi:MAG: hypothetical protein MZV70_36080 [Desulfobacterales bacterium]|nr:hypothetical protein [Desulfobacterales bacterium]
MRRSWELTIIAMVCYWLGFSDQHSQLRHHLRQLPGQPGPGHRDADLRNGCRGPAGNGRPDDRPPGWSPCSAASIADGIRPLFFSGVADHDRHLRHRR